MIDSIGVLACALLLCAVLWATGQFIPYDDTDAPEQRSGLTLYTDHKTGCQYLKGGAFGGLTPRLDAKGRHMCEVRK